LRLKQERQKVEQEKLTRIEQKRKKKTKEHGNQQPNPAKDKSNKKQTTSSPSAIQKNRKRATKIDFSKLAESVTQQTAESRSSASMPQIQEDIGKQAIPQEL